jgi:hypothetical protein
MFRSLVVVSVALGSLPSLAAARLEGIDVRPAADRVDVVLRASEPLTFQSWSRSAPATVVVDLLDTAAEPRTLQKVEQMLAGIEVTRHDARGAQLSRVSLQLKHAVDFDVTARGSEITVSLFTGKGQKAASNFKSAKPTLLAMSTSRGVATDAPSGIVEGSLGRSTSEVELAQAGEGPAAMSYIGFKNTSANSRVYARLNKEAKFTVRKEGDNLVVLEIQNATIPLRNNKNHLDATFFDSAVKMITPSEVEDATPTIRITIEMKSAVPYEAKLEGREVVVTFRK